jgi:NADH:ubiquinone oxidoreductase subunit 5 (subunit L)/multisubunit Na+/H+ antiporter MnhA subunit
MIAGTHLLIHEKLSFWRKASRVVGQVMALLIAVVTGRVLSMVFDAPQQLPLALADAAITAPWPVALLLLLLGLALIAVAFFISQLPLRRSFAFDRANFYVMTGKHMVRHGLASVLLSQRPATITVGAERYAIHPQDADRLAGLLQVVFAHSQRRVQPVAISNPTEVAEIRRKHFVHPSEPGHPTQGSAKPQKATGSGGKTFIERHPTIV